MQTDCTTSAFHVNGCVLYAVLYEQDRNYISFMNSVLHVINELIQIKKAVIHLTENVEVAAVPLTSAN